MDELLKEDIDPKKLFDSKEYITQVINNESLEEEVDDAEKRPEVNSSTENEVKLITSLLTDPQHKSVRHQTLKKINDEKQGETLLVAVAKNKNEKIQHLLIAACWETEIDFSKYLPFFILLALNENYLISLEAITVISTMEGPFEQDKVKDAINKIKEKQSKLTDEKAVLFNDLRDVLQGFENKE